MNINIFYHIYVCKGVNPIIKEQIDALENSDILNTAKLHIHITQDDIYSIDKSNNLHLKKIATNLIVNNKNDFEISTLKSLYNHASLNDSIYLYFHTKGATRINDSCNGCYSYKNVENWRNIMEHFCIYHWKKCVSLLDKNDLVGCNYMKEDYIHEGQLAHYSGNFWWSNSSFIRKLSLEHLNSRLDAEFWIGSIKHKAICLYPLPLAKNKHDASLMENHNRCFIYTPKEKYFNKIKIQKFKNFNFLKTNIKALKWKFNNLFPN